MFRIARKLKAAVILAVGALSIFAQRDDFEEEMRRIEAEVRRIEAQQQAASQANTIRNRGGSYNSIINEHIAAANIRNLNPSRRGTVTLPANSTPLNLRPCPRAIDDCSPIVALEHGTTITVLGTSADGRWHKISHNNITAYASSRFININSARQRPAARGGRR